MIPGNEHNVLDLPTELIAHLPHPIHNLVWFALRKVREGTHTFPGVHDDDLTWASAIRCESSGLRGIEGDRELIHLNVVEALALVTGSAGLSGDRTDAGKNAGS